MGAGITICIIAISSITLDQYWGRWEDEQGIRRHRGSERPRQSTLRPH